MNDIVPSGTTRRTLLGAATWGAPAVVLAGAAPAYARSGADTGVMLFSAGSVTNPERTAFAVSSVTSGGTRVALTVSRSRGAALPVGADPRFVPAETSNQNFSAPPVGPLSNGTSASTLLVQQHYVGSTSLADRRGRYTFTFDEDVTDLTFSVSGLGAGWGELGQNALFFGGDAVPTLSKPVASKVFLGGRDASAQSGSHDPASDVGMVYVAFAGPIRSFWIEFYSASGLVSYQPEDDSTMSFNVHQMSYTLA